MSDAHDDRIRDALRAQAEGVTADDDLLTRIRTAAATRSPLVRRTPWLLAAAAVAVIAAVVGVLVSGDDEQTVRSVDHGVTTPTPLDLEDLVPSAAAACRAGQAQVLFVVMGAGAADTDIAVVGARLEQARATGDAGISSIRYVDRGEALLELRDRYADQPQKLQALAPDTVPTHFEVGMTAGTDDTGLRSEIADLRGVRALTSVRCDDGAPPPPVGDAPAMAVAVTERGRVVVVDTASGAVIRDLGGFDDPTDPAVAGREGGPFSITGVALHPNGRDLYVETCCEPAGGNVFRVPLDGSVSIDAGELQPVSAGYGLDISADGRRMAFVSGPLVGVVDLETGDLVHEAESADGTRDWVQAALNHDGTILAIERALERDDQGRVVRSDARTTSLLDGTYEEHPVTSGRFMPLWIEGGTMLASAPAPGEELRDANVDASGAWILVVTADGRLLGRGERTIAIDGGPYVAADW